MFILYKHTVQYIAHLFKMLGFKSGWPNVRKDMTMAPQHRVDIAYITHTSPPMSILSFFCGPSKCVFNRGKPSDRLQSLKVGDLSK